ncbi:hypothetical protein [Nocardia fluminea]|uniref:Uncharacterized protein n=1 Tax=Nocardia fluminea TaxID=134984 RepID=A0A2N3VKQ4_9NOCA|nr:hypothetical protein [Nocardia fluminea]PKV82199.1 hypothetical protein ATK86_6685 [Nocardia fluminea]
MISIGAAFRTRSWLFAPGGTTALGHRGAMLDRPHPARAQALPASGGRA